MIPYRQLSLSQSYTETKKNNVDNQKTKIKKCNSLCDLISVYRNLDKDECYKTCEINVNKY